MADPRGKASLQPCDNEHTQLSVCWWPHQDIIWSLDVSRCNSLFLISERPRVTSWSHTDTGRVRLQQAQAKGFLNFPCTKPACI